MKSICLITLVPNEIWCDFLNTFTKYVVYVIVDDNNYNLNPFKNKYSNIHFIQISDERCKIHGYIDTSFTLNKLISGWDKALYYFGVENIVNDFVWFMEDDVFFYSEDTLLRIDEQYKKDDLLSNEICENKDGNKNSWHWNKIKTRYTPPYYNGMMCIVRFSNTMMKRIHKYATNNHTLFFLEALIPTVAIKNELVCKHPIEFKNIYYRHTFNTEDIDMCNLYHPIKELPKHVQHRNHLIAGLKTSS